MMDIKKQRALPNKVNDISSQEELMSGRRIIRILAIMGGFTLVMIIIAIIFANW